MALKENANGISLFISYYVNLPKIVINNANYVCNMLRKIIKSLSCRFVIT